MSDKFRAINNQHSSTFGCFKVLSLAPVAFVNDINILNASTSQSAVLNSLAERFQESKKLQFLYKCMVLSSNS